MKRLSIIGLIGIVVCSAAVAIDNLTVQKLGNGYQVVEWRWSATDGPPVAYVDPVYGQIHSVNYIPDPVLPVANTTTLSVYIYDRITSSGATAEYLKGSLTGKNGIAAWEIDGTDATIPVAGPIKLRVGGALDVDGEAARGILRIVVNPYASQTAGE